MQGRGVVGLFIATKSLTENGDHSERVAFCVRFIGHLRRIVVLFDKISGKSDRNEDFAVGQSILGQAPGYGYYLFVLQRFTCVIQ